MVIDTAEEEEEEEEEAGEKREGGELEEEEEAKSFDLCLKERAMCFFQKSRRAGFSD